MIDYKIKKNPSVLTPCLLTAVAMPNGEAQVADESRLDPEINF
jgi:hypothetical protein